MRAFSCRSSVTLMLTIVALMLSLMCVVVDSSTVMDVFRLIQYDLHGEPLGSRRASLNQYAEPFPRTPIRGCVWHPNGPQGTASGFDNSFEWDKAMIAGILFVLPTDFDAEGRQCALHCITCAWKAHWSRSERALYLPFGLDVEAITELEMSLISRKIDIPVYFAVDNDELQTMVRSEQATRQAWAATALTCSLTHFLFGADDRARQHAYHGPIPVAHAWRSSLSGVDQGSQEDRRSHPGELPEQVEGRGTATHPPHTKPTFKTKRTRTP
eukprot:4566484-Pyramimonas_sp.AAC.1